MGNQMSGAVPSMILPVERYLTDLNDFDFMGSLGSTRFLKAVKAMYKSVSANTQSTKAANNDVAANGEHLSAVEISREGICVMKIFVISDPTLPLAPYVKEIEEVKSKLGDSPNCLPFRKILLTEKAAILVRQYGKDNLYDRLSNRPGLKDIEKRWIAFQLLKALEQCKLAKICHGDIKSQNILISSWTWVYLTDFASYKPTLLPTDNPADYSYFFDSSRRRTCYIAPERFVSSIEFASRTTLPDNQTFSSSFPLNHAMDIFSLGCVLAELFTDGCAPFDFSQLLAYRERKFFPSKCLDAIKNMEIRAIIENMLDLDPAKRLTADQYLDKYRSTVFPDIFYTFLFPYVKQFCDLPRMSFDDKIEKLFEDAEKNVNALKDPTSLNSMNSSYLILISMITSLTRSLTFCDSRLKALSLLKKFAAFSKESYILDRILPYVLYMCHDSFPRIRAEAIHSVSYIVSLVQNIPKSDTRIFVDYIFPALNGLINDPSTLVRTALAEEMASLAQTTSRFLEYASLNSEEDPQVQAGTDSFTKMSYQSELKSLQEIVQDMVVTLLNDRDNNIRRTLVHSGLPRLCVFFGRQKASDVLVSHLITFLNDKNDWRLRSSFYECVTALAAYIGWQSTMILKPLLHQGFRDFEENVIFQTLACLKNLAQLGLLQKPSINELLQDAVPFLAHPNFSLRIGASSFICACGRTLNVADVHCKLTPLVKPYLKTLLMKLDREDVLLRSLRDPIPRAMWDAVVRSPMMLDFLKFLNGKRFIYQLGDEQQHSNNSSATSLTMTTVPEDPHLANFYQKLLALGLNEEIEERFRCFADILSKMRKMRNSASADDVSPTETNRPGVVDLSQLNIRRKHADLTLDRGGKRTFPLKQSQRENLTSMNPEWRQMFGPTDSSTTPADGDATPDVSKIVDQSVLGLEGAAGEEASAKPVEFIFDSLTSSASDFATKNDDNLSLITTDTHPTGGNIDTSLAAETNVRMASCRSDLATLIERKREEWRRSSRLAFVDESNLTSSDVGEVLNSSFPPSSWKPLGELVAHLHEHRSAVTSLSVHPSGRFFISSSSDGSVKLWDCRKLEGRSMANRSKLTYNKIGGRIKFATFLNDGFVCCSDSGRIQVVKLDSGLAKSCVAHEFQTDMENSGPLLQFYSYFDGSTTMIIGLSHHGHVICWDTRESKPVWRFCNASSDGMATSLCVDEHRKQWACVATDTGRLVLWDIRFHLPINTCIHPAEKPFYRLWWHPTHHSRILASVIGRGEIDDWDLEASTRTSVIWPDGNTPPLSYQDEQEMNTGDLVKPKLTTTSVYAHPNVDNSSLFVTCGDSAGCINYWDLVNVKNSFVVSSSDVYDNSQKTRAFYKSQVIDGIRVFLSLDGKSNKTSTQSDYASMRSPTELRATTFHHDAISDMALCRTSQQLLISASRDGVVKIWK